ncbi:LuxR family transcriptional regulator [Streptomyces sp. ISL-11]|uniref:helix-turn-helix transcriptional regulator n=1 Tax=Streptomyces sp. ISL-11 TaxID=2819174 RepID=UPI0035B040D7
MDVVREAVSCEREAERFAGHSAVELVTGASAVAERLLGLRIGAREEVCALLADRPGSAAADMVNDVRHRAVVERAALAGLMGLPGLSTAFGRGGPARVRVVDRVPAELVVADRALALVPLTPRSGEPTEPTALLVHPGVLLASLVDLFEDVWHEALPLRVCADGRRYEGPAAGPDAVDLQVLSLLLIGLTDASVAKQLGLGLRTVQRRVKRLMELAGVTTRLQLGWHAAERGWTPRR